MAADIARQLNTHDYLITRREEWMIARMLTTGSITIVGDGVSDVIDIGHNNTDLLAGGSVWGGAASNPINNFRQWKRTTIQLSGITPNICVMGDDVADAVLGLMLQPEVPLWLEPYLPIAVVAALDAVFGALRAFLDGIFDDKVFVISFISNVLIAALIVYLGDKLGVGGQLSTGVIVVLGIRIFSNVAAIRRHIFHA
jgi:small basic protein